MGHAALQHRYDHCSYEQVQCLKALRTRMGLGVAQKGPA
jgi:hypothetical protein